MNAVEEARKLIDGWLFGEVKKLIESCDARESHSSDSDSEMESSFVIVSRSQSLEIIDQIEDQSSFSCFNGQKMLKDSPKKETEKQLEIELDSDEPSLLSEEFESDNYSDETPGGSDKESERRSVTVTDSPTMCIQPIDTDNFMGSFLKKSEVSRTEEDRDEFKRRVKRTEQEWKLMTPDVREYLQWAARSHSEFYGDEKFDEEAPFPIGLFLELLQYAHSWNLHRLQGIMPSPPRCPLLAHIPDNVVIFFVKIIYARFGVENSSGTEAVCA